MTDNDIIKALECCTSWGCGTSCADCPLHDTGCLHFNKLGEILDLINRQKAEIERLKEQRDKAIEAIEEFARRAYLLNPFACKYCAKSVEDGRACLWKAEHEDEAESCLGRYFEYRKEMAGEK